VVGADARGPSAAGEVHRPKELSAMSEPGSAGSSNHTSAGYDAVVVGASLAGSATAIMLGRAGARVALVDQREDASAYKRICTHFVQSSAVPTLERLELLEPMMAAGALRSRARLWTRWGWIEPPAKSLVPSSVNLRRSLLDPLIRETAAAIPGVELMLGRTAQRLERSHDARGQDVVTGVEVRAKQGSTALLRAPLVVGADGRGSRVAKLAEVPYKSLPHGRFAYGGYYEGPAPHGAPDASLWFLDPHMAAAFPTDSGLTFYAVMPTMDRLPEFRADPRAALEAFVAAIPEAPPIAESRLVESVQGKIDMTNVSHRAAVPGLALVGDAALAIDPLWGVGCGWALQSAEWLADSVAPALGGAEPLEAGLGRYRRRHGRALRGHAAVIYDYADGRKMNSGERMLFSAAARDERVAGIFEAFGTRNVGPARTFTKGLPLAAVVHARRVLGGRTSRSSAHGSAEPAQSPVMR
jgi:2-polyprenyl-6-methoxyphenol hydroxylase-like FAD-dependent oxidoreductase